MKFRVQSRLASSATWSLKENGLFLFPVRVHIVCRDIAFTLPGLVMNKIFYQSDKLFPAIAEAKVG